MLDLIIYWLEDKRAEGRRWDAIVYIRKTGYDGSDIAGAGHFSSGYKMRRTAASPGKSVLLKTFTDSAIKPVTYSERYDECGGVNGKQRMIRDIDKYSARSYWAKKRACRLFSFYLVYRISLTESLRIVASVIDVKKQESCQAPTVFDLTLSCGHV